MKKTNIMKLTVAVLFIVLVLQSGFAAYSMGGIQSFRSYMKDIFAHTDYRAAATTASAATADATAPEEVKIPQKEIDISKIVLSAETEAQIKNMDAKNADKNIHNYKVLLAALNVPEQFQAAIESLYMKKHKVPDVMTAYEFLYHNYGNIADLEGLIAKKEAGESWSKLFKAYRSSQQQYEPSNFEAGQLDTLFKKPGITSDDIMIADRISQLEGTSFEKLIDERASGKNWKNINAMLGVVNTSESLPKVAVTSAQVKKYVKLTKLSEDKVLKALVLAQKLGKDGAEVVDKVKGGSSEEDIMAFYLEAKYK